jgi:hypothetical protein
MYQKVSRSICVLEGVPDHTWSYSQHNARNIIRANWMFMKNLKAREAGISSSSGINGSFLAIGSGTEILRMWA